MMNDKMKVTIQGNEYEFARGISLQEVSETVKNNFKYDIILAKVNNEYRELHTKLIKDCKLEFYDLTHKDANRIYVNGLIFLMEYVYRKLTGHHIKVNHSLDKGLYITVEEDITLEFIEKLENKMREVVNQDLPIDKLNVSRMNTIEYFESMKEPEKVKNIKYNTNTTITLYKLDDLYNYFYSKMPIRTGVLRYFELTFLNSKGFVLRFPTVYHHAGIKPFEPRENLYNLFQSSRKWAKTINLEYVVDLNEKVEHSKINEIIRMDEMNKNAELLDIAKKIASKRVIKVILIAGPSSSGKTTTCNKLALCLKSCGLNPTMISMDDYFVEREETPLDENGQPDFECLEAVDLNLFNNTIKELLQGNEVTVPTYNFLLGQKEFKNKQSLGEEDILLIEGIHALNPKILEEIPSEKKCKIYLSALTELNVDKHTRISTTDNRLLRRIVRDNRTRGYKVEETLKNWTKVRKGEEKYIFPYQDIADYTLNTALIYEIGVLKIYVEPLLYSVPLTSDYYTDAKRLINFLRVFLPITPEEIPIDSVLREFIGGGCFRV